ncbi:MAG: ATP-binding protein [Candidatus Acidiferrales bacterium]
MGRAHTKKKRREAPPGTRRSASLAVRAPRERSLADQELDRLFTLTLDLLCVAGFDGYFKRLNPAWERTLGFTLQELLSRPYLDFIHPDDRQPTVAAADQLTTGVPVITFENRYRCQDGSYKWLLWNSMPVTEQQLTYGAARDITERKLAEQRLAAQYATARVLAESPSLDEALRKILQAICENLGWEHGAVWHVDRTANLLRCAETWHLPSVSFVEFEAVSRRTAFPPGIGLPGRVWASGQPAWIPNVVEDTNFPRAPIAAREGLRAAFGFPLLIGTETVGIMEFFSREIRRPDEALLQTMATLGSQIGQLMARRRAAEVIQKDADEIADLYNNAPCGYHSLDANGVFLRINDTELRWLGYGREEIVGKKRFTDLIPPEGRRLFQEKFPVFKERGWVRDLEFEMVRQDGTTLPVLLNATAVRDSSGNFLMSRSTLFDMTDRRALERMKDEFLAVVSHELRTPLTAIRGALSLLAGGHAGTLNERGQQMLTIATESTDRLVRLMNDVLDIERMELGRFHIVKQSCDAAQLVRRAVDALQPLADKAGITLSLTTQSAPLWADPDRLIQTLTNLLSNALKFSPAGTTVWVSVTRQNDQVVFEVKDQGRGIPAEKLQTIFERFQQVEAADARNRGGTGLGLFICRNIVQQHDGRLWVESTPGQGSRFFFTVPLPQGTTTSQQ